MGRAPNLELKELINKPSSLQLLLCRTDFEMSVILALNLVMCTPGLT